MIDFILSSSNRVDINPKIDMLAANALRGEFLSHFAKIESWICRIYPAFVEENKIPYLFGDKFSQLKCEIEKQSTLLKNHKSACNLLKKLTPYAKLRSYMSHAEIKVSYYNDTPVYIFHMPGRKLKTKILTNPSLPKDDFLSMNKKLRNLAARISKLKLEESKQD